MIHKCRFCSNHFPSYREVRNHVSLLHPQEFAKISQWLGKTQDKLAGLELLAKEGMEGRQDRNNG